MMEKKIMSNFNKQIDEKLKAYPENIQDIARRAIEAARKLDASKLADMMEARVKSIARKEVQK